MYRLNTNYFYFQNKTRAISNIISMTKTPSYFSVYYLVDISEVLVCSLLKIPYCLVFEFLLFLRSASPVLKFSLSQGDFIHPQHGFMCY